MKLCRKPWLEEAGAELRVPKPRVAGGDKLKSSAVAEVSKFSATMGLCAVVIAEVSAASVRSVTRGGEAAAQPREAKSCAFIPERSWRSWGMRTVHQAIQKPFQALAWGRRGETDGHMGWWPQCLIGLYGLFGRPPLSKLVQIHISVLWWVLL